MLGVLCMQGDHSVAESLLASLPLLALAMETQPVPRPIRAELRKLLLACLAKTQSLLASEAPHLFNSSIPLFNSSAVEFNITEMVPEEQEVARLLFDRCVLHSAFLFPTLQLQPMTCCPCVTALASFATTHSRLCATLRLIALRACTHWLQVLRC